MAQVKINGHTFKVISAPKRARGIKAAYNNSWMTSLDDCYKDYSDAKARAMRYCEDLCDDLNGTKLRILGHNCMTFSVAFTCDTNEGQYLIYITKDADYLVL